MQPIFDKLYSDAKKGKKFTKLLDYIAMEENILLAFRNIKSNSGSRTPGTDNITIDYYKGMDKGEFVNLVQRKLTNYHPKSVRRVEIPKPNGKTRPLGIPCMIDRIIQQCIKQVLEPICEAKFHDRSYGFRPNRSAENAMGRAMLIVNHAQMHHVVDMDIKGFFDNVNHAKLKKQMWHLGIQDKNLMCIIGKILKSEIKGIGIPTKGTPQGGIISPLLANIALNELDWWLSSQWETFKTKRKYSSNSNRYSSLNRFNAKLKQIFFVRYADDFKIFCRDWKTAQKVFIATKMWLEERLGLEISPEKSKITNIRKRSTEFLGIELRAEHNGEKYVCRSSITKKAIDRSIQKIKKQIKVIQRNPEVKQINKYNAIILGIHNYFKMATEVTEGLKEINFRVRKTLDIRLRRITSNKIVYSKAFETYYSNYKHLKQRTIKGITLFPIYGKRTEKALSLPRGTCNYTVEGREVIHKVLSNNVNKLIKSYIARGNQYQTTEMYDNSISLLSGQKGKCMITKLPLTLDFMECHHRTPKSLGGTDDYKNLVWLCTPAHRLVHATKEETIKEYLKMLDLDVQAIKRLNRFRKLVGNSVIN